jgi:hypothetical protein
LIDENRSLGDIHAAGHRVVHGGELFKESVIINDEVLKGIEDCIDLAPLHNPNNLRGIRALPEIFGQATPQVAVLPLFTRRFPSTLTCTRCPTISTVRVFTEQVVSRIVHPAQTLGWTIFDRLRRRDWKRHR